MLFVVALIACGDDDDASSVDTTSAAADTSTAESASSATDTTDAAGSTSVTTPGSPTSSLDTEADQAAAEAALLVLTDFPAGWSEVPQAELTKDEEVAQRRSAACFGIDDSSVADFGGAVAETGDFASPTDEIVSQRVGLAPSVIEAEERMAGLSGSEVPACYEDVVQDLVEERIENPPSPADAFPDGTTIGDVTVAGLNMSPVGDEMIAYRVTLPLNISGSAVELFTDLVAVRSGRGLASFEFQSELAPFPTEDAERYLALGAERLAEAT